MKQLSVSKKKAKDTLRQKREKPVVAGVGIDNIAAPDELSDDAKKEWDVVAPLLFENKLLTENDRKLLMAYCQETAKYWRIQKDIATGELVLPLKDKKGKVINYMRNPLLDLSDKALNNAISIGLQFGLTPLSRGKINLPNKPAADTPEEKAASLYRSLMKKAM